MKKIIAALLTASVIATASLGATTPAEAHGPGPGFGIAAGIIGGLAVGSIIASHHRYNDGYYPSHRRYHDNYVVVRDDEAYCRDVRVEDYYGRHYWKRICR
jgi:hypothetical protein